jgi:vanillate O-demethylase ferredoxin subunit
MAFVERIRAAPFADSVHFHLDDGPDVQRLDIERVLGLPSRDLHLYVCGPSGFMSWILEGARRCGWASENIHYEYFAATPVESSGDSAFEVEVASTGKTLVVPADRSVLAVLQEAGVEIETSCEQGVCGSCLTRVLEGRIDHRDMFLSDAERQKGDQFAPCVSRAVSKKLVLDL